MGVLEERRLADARKAIEIGINVVKEPAYPTWAKVKIVYLMVAIVREILNSTEEEYKGGESHV